MKLTLIRPGNFVVMRTDITSRCRTGSRVLLWNHSSETGPPDPYDGFFGRGSGHSGRENVVEDGADHLQINRAPVRFRNATTAASYRNGYSLSARRPGKKIHIVRGITHLVEPLIINSRRRASPAAG